MSGLKKSQNISLADRRVLVESSGRLSVRSQCNLLGMNRSSYYYKPGGESCDNLNLMELIDAQYMKTPFYGSRRMAVEMSRQTGYSVNRKRVQRLMRLMGIEAIYPKPRMTINDQEHKIYPYLLRGVAIEQPNHVWSTDITYIRMKRGFLYLVAVIDWFSRYVLSWQLSNSLERWFCIEALEDALQLGKPQIFNTDQGCQFTSVGYTGILKAANIEISMDGKGRALDNIFVERLWRSVKYEEVYLRHYETVEEAYEKLGAYWTFYNTQRPHQALNYRTPQEVYYSAWSQQKER